MLNSAIPYRANSLCIVLLSPVLTLLNSGLFVSTECYCSIRNVRMLSGVFVQNIDWWPLSVTWVHRQSAAITFVIFCVTTTGWYLMMRRSLCPNIRQRILHTSICTSDSSDAFCFVFCRNLMTMCSVYTVCCMLIANLCHFHSVIQLCYFCFRLCNFCCAYENM